MPSSFSSLLRNNRNYRFTWMGQVVSEIGDHFNNIAVFSLAMDHGEAMSDGPHAGGLVVMGVMIARALPAMLVGPFAGVMLDRLDRKHLMIASDLVRAVVALLFILTIRNPGNWMLYALSAMLMAASPFFTAGRSSILPRIASRDELHTANSLTQTTNWVTTAIGAYLAGATIEQFGYTAAFILNTFSFLASAWCIVQLRVPEGHFRAERKSLTEIDVVKPWHEYRDGLRYMIATPLILGIALVGVGWATGGGAAQILFSIFGKEVFDRGASGIGTIWAAAGVGLVVGGTIAHRIGERLPFGVYKWIVSVCYIVHGFSFVAFSVMENFAAAVAFMALSRAAVGVSSVLNLTQIMRHVSDEYRGRIFATMESMIWTTMMLSMLAAGVGTQYASPRVVGVCAGIASSMTALFWGWANLKGRLPEPALEGISPEEVELRARLRA